MKYANLLETIGDSGRFQKRLCVFLFFANLPLPWFAILPVFTQYKTAVRCNMDSEFYQNETDFEISWNKIEESDVYFKEVCGVTESDILNRSFLNKTRNTTSQVSCTNGWVYEDQGTVIAEFNLVCDDFQKPTLALTIFLIAMGFGTFSGSLVDRFGRRPVFLFITYYPFIIAGITGFAVNFETYAVCLFFIGASVFVAYNISVTIMSEMLGTRRHDVAMIVILFSWSAGLLISCLIAYMSQTWRWYVRSCSLLGLLFAVPVWKLFPESLRWQIVSGRTKDAKRNILFIAKMNGKVVDVDSLCENLIDTEIEKNKTPSNDIGYFRACWNSSSLRTRFITLNLCWMIIQLLYFAISLNPISKTSSRFVHVLIVGLAELPGYLFGYLVSKHFGLTWTCSLSIGIGGIICLVVPFLYSADPLFLSVATFLGKCFAASAYGYVILLVAQTAPTMIRSTAISVASLCGKIGGISMPYLLILGNEENPRIPYFIMGSLCCLSALLLLMLIPNSMGHIPDTLKEAEEIKSNYLHVILGKVRSKSHQEHERVRTTSDKEFRV